MIVFWVLFWAIVSIEVLLVVNKIWVMAITLAIIMPPCLAMAYGQFWLLNEAFK